MRSKGVYVKIIDRRSSPTIYLLAAFFALVFTVLFLGIKPLLAALLFILFYALLKLDFFFRSSDLHAKIYVIDDHVFIGSVNFTYSGFYKNYEAFVEIKDKEIADKLAYYIEKNF